MISSYCIPFILMYHTHKDFIAVQNKAWMSNMCGFHKFCAEKNRSSLDFSEIPTSIYLVFVVTNLSYYTSSKSKLEKSSPSHCLKPTFQPAVKLWVSVKSRSVDSRAWRVQFTSLHTCSRTLVILVIRKDRL